MVKAIINVNDHTNQILNIIKAKFDLKDKSQAIETLAIEYEKHILEPQLKPEYIEKAKKIIAKKHIHIGTVSNLRKKLGM